MTDKYTLAIASSVFTFFMFGQAFAAESSFLTPRTIHGYPDLQGYWTNPYITPLERPLTLGTRRAYDEDEVLALAEELIAIDRERQAPLDPNRPAPDPGSQINNQADGNFEIMPTEVAFIKGEYRTSYIVDPPNGRLPYLPNAEEADIYAARQGLGFSDFDGPENLSPLDRCLTPSTQLPLLRAFGDVNLEGGNPAGDNPVRNVQIVQNKNYVVILSEYFSLVRIIRLQGGHLSQQGPKWMGDSIAYYENDSLIINTKHFRPEQSVRFLRSSDQFEVQEKYTRIANDELLFEFTVTDPKIFSRPFTAEMSLKRLESDKKLYEYACHEGNYSLPSILRAARMEEIGYLD